jgi:predicted metal-binding protein
MIKDLQEKLDKAGVFEHGLIDPKEVEFTEEVRKYCEDNTCRQYGKTWACPPAVGTVDECRVRAQKYEHMLVFSGKYDLVDSFDWDGMMAGMQDFKRIAHNVEAEIRGDLGDYFMLSNEGCGTCEECTYPDAPCRFPDRVHGSIEGYGIYVTKLAKQVGIHYNNGPNTMTYFGAVLY